MPAGVSKRWQRNARDGGRGIKRDEGGREERGGEERERENGVTKQACRQRVSATSQLEVVLLSVVQLFAKI